MKDWSAKTLPPGLNYVNLYFDTNFLMYLFEGSFNGINTAYEIVRDLGLHDDKPLFVKMTVSQYVLFEFFENRKKKHYKNHLATEGVVITVEDEEEVHSKHVAFNYFKVNGHNYMDIYPAIKTLVEADIARLNEFLIEHEEHILNEKLYEPTKHLSLTSRISRHDCMITSSAVYPNIENTNYDVIIWTNDEQYHEGFNECPEIPAIYPECKIKLEFVRSLRLSNPPHTENNLLHEPHFGQLNDFIPKK